jgi:hypothetical protein
MAPSPIVSYDPPVGAVAEHTDDTEGLAMLVTCSRALAAGLFLLAGAALDPASAQRRNDLFTVSPVPVDVTAENAIAARDHAIAEGEQRAFRMLIERLVQPEDRKNVPKVTAAKMNDLVQGFQVAHERRSGVRYLADYTVHFRADAVRQFLTNAGVSFAEVSSKPVLVLPVYTLNGNSLLWEDSNAWRVAWQNSNPGTGLVPVVRPLGEIEDLQAIDASGATAGDDGKLLAIAQRYGNPDVLVSTATPRMEGGTLSGIDVATTRYTPGSPGGEQHFVVNDTANPGESADALMARAIGDTMQQVEQAWKDASTPDAKAGGVLLARVPAASLQDWVAVRDRLSGVPVVRGSRLISLDRQGARVELHYIGDPQQLRLALGQRDLELSGNDPDWVLQRRAAEAAPVAPAAAPAAEAAPH